MQWQLGILMSPSSLTLDQYWANIGPMHCSRVRCTAMAKRWSNVHFPAVGSLTLVQRWKVATTQPFGSSTLIQRTPSNNWLSFIDPRLDQCKLPNNSLCNVGPTLVQYTLANGWLPSISTTFNQCTMANGWVIISPWHNVIPLFVNQHNGWPIVDPPLTHRWPTGDPPVTHRLGRACREIATSSKVWLKYLLYVAALGMQSIFVLQFWNIVLLPKWKSPCNG